MAKISMSPEVMKQQEMTKRMIKEQIDKMVIKTVDFGELDATNSDVITILIEGWDMSTETI